MEDSCKKCGYWLNISSNRYKCYTHHCPAYKRDHKDTITTLNYKIGEEVMVECMSGLGSGGKEKVTNITKKYNSDTGEPYYLIWCGSHAFYEKSGNAYNPPLMYYIHKIKK